MITGMINRSDRRITCLAVFLLLSFYPAVGQSQGLFQRLRDRVESRLEGAEAKSERVG